MAETNEHGWVISRETMNQSADMLKRVYMGGPYGHMDQVFTSAFSGLNHRKAPTALPMNREQTPLIFITRPRLNLSSDNLRADRKFNSLNHGGQYSLARAIRCLLDYRLMASRELSSPFVDNRQAFIPIFMETTQSVSGWQDIAAQTFTTPGGRMQEEQGHIDGPVDIYRSYDLDFSLRNVDGNIAIYMLAMWIFYQAYVFEGAMVPYPEYIMYRRRDFDSRVYSIALQPDGYTISQIMACGACHPVSVSSSGAHNFEFGKTFNDANNTVTARFKAYGQMQFDDIVIDQFNRTVIQSNSEMADEYRASRMRMIPRDELFIFNHQGYPRININTGELEWWIPYETYREFIDFVGSDADRVSPTLARSEQQ